jgi:hypothetical protein
VTATGKRSVRLAGTVIGALMALGGCATRTPVPSLHVTAPPEAKASRPELPAGIPERLSVPPIDADGHYRTINSALTPEQAGWHVRSALNVAVLACRGPDEAVLAADYNAMLRRQKAVLAKAYDAVQARFRVAGGSDWQTAQDIAATRVYNFFALPPAKPGFCAVATSILAEARTIDPAGFLPFAGAALARLEAPFLDVYRGYDQYRRELAAWESGQDSGTAKAAASAPKLDYVGIDTLIDWRPELVDGRQRIAVR